MVTSEDAIAFGHLECDDGEAKIMKVHLATAYPAWTAIPVFRRLAASDRFKAHEIVEDADQADIILFADSRCDNDDWRLPKLRRHSLVRGFREKTFVYNEADQPWRALPGVYVGMPRRHFAKSRQRSCPYIDANNRYIAVEAACGVTPDRLFSFVGRRCHWTRDVIVRISHPRGHIEDTSGLNFFGGFDQHIETRRKTYAETILRSKFILCPRGAGVTSFRLYEAIQAGRVPVVLGDDWVPPEGPDWGSFILRVPEINVGNVIDIIERNESRFPEMSAAALMAWKKWFAPDVLFHRMVESCAEILRSRVLSEGVAARLPSRRYGRLWLKHMCADRGPAHLKRFMKCSTRRSGEQ